ncbi:hypothetical protein L484_010693 [Morus notabilis]|uniref:Uncharacterized protein n=1 Tax=Morus notabilis TaxID=981085 RepID=W9SP19_9ROSA|nr:hypothetical protein L484_010693 [Morus notabilis]
MCLGTQNFAAQSHEALNSLELPLLFALSEAGSIHQSSITLGSKKLHGTSRRCKMLVFLMHDPSEDG